MALLLNGIGIARGIAIGRVYHYAYATPDIRRQTLAAEAIEAEIERFNTALQATADELRAIKDRIPQTSPAEVGAFIDTHLLMLQDHLLARVPIEHIRALCCNAEWALKLQHDELIATFDAMADPYLRTRRDDVSHVVGRVLRRLHHGVAEPALASPPRASIVVAEDLSPSDVATLQQARIGGLVTEYGGPLSHTAILARSLGIPTLMGVHAAGRLLRDGERVILDGAAGLLLADADDALTQRFRQQMRAQQARGERLAALRDRPTVTADGAAVSLQANIELDSDIAAVRQVGADGVGLYRTEFLFMGRASVPDETEQYTAYRRAVRNLRGQPLTIRTLDLGGDKLSGAIDLGEQAPNPAMGLRAIRLSLREPGLFVPQLRAILRASAHGPVRLMLPMLTDLSELDHALGLIAGQRAALDAAGQRYDPAMPIGAMIEVPAAALMAEAFASRLDFLSIGTNDLIQYTLAIDRTDDAVNDLYDPLHPAVLRLIQLTLEGAARARVPVAMCGEMAGDPAYTRLLLGLGLREFSVPPNRHAEVKYVITQSHAGALEKAARTLSGLPERSARQQALQALNRGLQEPG
ncbi:phosphoenolpyruvate--protein phosphotransferase [Acidihalobacter ferrooxydans]|uniref:Phosphoenolpyruvate-protein phosphotransferase n=1 Tax=Acidihalobacter ferrooxydans TaxID=1765967 RepID=A0A1P8UJC7_9GAMM|nr:phosphoenolpyruvate--protein phosphotransferase [Acidihalobacter ferrooxydans]APZ43946.1 phosphoenolpyruvate--protein phosphotransferase [Acidihalobacter ferrooxydans]